jgi:hypothetical protein
VTLPATAGPTALLATPTRLAPVGPASTATVAVVTTVTDVPASPTPHAVLAFVPIRGRPSLLEFYEEG